MSCFQESHWLSLGYGQEHTAAMMRLQATLFTGISILNRLVGQTMTAAFRQKTDVKIGAGRANDLPEGLLLPDDSMLPLWKSLSDLLCSLATHESGFIRLRITNVHLTKEILTILSPALKTAPLHRLALVNNRIGSEGIRLVKDSLEKNPCMRIFTLRENDIKCGCETLSLVEAARNHPSIRIISLDDCDIGRQLLNVPGIVPALLGIEAVGIRGNGIGSRGASLIAAYLATNPSINFLDLDDNLFNDDDASMIASALKKNTNLIQLSLRGNNFTNAGIKTFYRSIFHDESLNTIHDSNHTCELVLFADDQPITIGLDGMIISLNGKHFEVDAMPESAKRRFMMAASVDNNNAFQMLTIEGRKKLKVIHALMGGDPGYFNMQYLNDIRLELIPNVLAFLRDSCLFSSTEENKLDSLFQVVRSRPGCWRHDID